LNLVGSLYIIHQVYYLRSFVVFFPRQRNKLQEQSLQLGYNSLVLNIFIFTLYLSSQHRRYSQSLQQHIQNLKKYPTLYDKRHCILTFWSRNFTF